ncbi:MAG TPA: DinB family protein [Terriglobales bacterium]|jgi:uncharacterized damage-inducible protein DinB
MTKIYMLAMALTLATNLAFGAGAPQSNNQSTDAKQQAQKPATPPPPPVGTTIEPATLYDRAVSNVEKEFVSLAEAMPADKYDFAPTTGEFKDVRKFGEQVKHVAEANMLFYGALLGQKHEEGEAKALTGKDQIVDYLKKSFELGHQAAKTMTPQNSFVTVAIGPGSSSRAGLMTLAVAHAFDHYGQMVVYGRMNGIVPPASRQQ